MAALAMTLLLVVVFFTPTEDTQKASDEGEEKGENNEEAAYAPWFNEGDPWFAEGDELNRLSGDELRALAEQNETIRKMLEEDQKLEPVRIESLEDLEHLPENYPEEKKRLEIADYLARQNLSKEIANISDSISETNISEANESAVGSTNQQ
ncbi:hypothetical protein MSHOH_2491 [Methanosarcina horonobensis HB-1 = JCM 15518]|uniref:Uncharacterized protein n=3 Tax=Methanosarcina horonobensis TaxID=418008 RepID=A0A0E3SB19_9EURY|nr:hypothetical protein MSHOH_2491 [Methanosarcina horonobensis HB-1 = JCM 15518]